MSNSKNNINVSASAPMPHTPVFVRRSPSDYRIGTCEFSKIKDFRWDRVSGGIQLSLFDMPFVYAYVWCTDIVGEIAHTGNHGNGCPHRIKVCILKQDNPDIYSCLAKFAGERPMVSRAKPETGNHCKVDILDKLQGGLVMRETDLTDYLVKIGHGRNNVKFVLKKLFNDKKLRRRKDPQDRRFNQYYIYKEVCDPLCVEKVQSRKT
jgi:hypothetical protein